jgi:hypothetical protein
MASAYNELAEIKLGALSPEPKWPEREADHLHEPSAEIKNAGDTRCFAFGEMCGE